MTVTEYLALIIVLVIGTAVAPNTLFFICVVVITTLLYFFLLMRENTEDEVLEINIPEEDVPFSLTDIKKYLIVKGTTIIYAEKTTDNKLDTFIFNSHTDQHAVSLTFPAGAGDEKDLFETILIFEDISPTEEISEISLIFHGGHRILLQYMESWAGITYIDSEMANLRFLKANSGYVALREYLGEIGL